ncbi:MAG: DUF4342 domain-containing protein [Anaerolineae bacterium]|nr:DUF4342 domain-containing protein [Anaerolineae bacterium]
MEEPRKTKSDTRRDIVDKIREVLHEINRRNLIIRRQDGTTVLSLPGLAAVLVAVVIPQLAVLLVIAHLVDFIKIDVTHNQ